MTTIEPPWRFEPAVPYRQTLDGFLGIEFEAISHEEVHAHFAVRTDLMQLLGMLHGGVYCAVAESLASIPTLLKADDDGQRVAGLSNYASFLRPITEGTVHAVARRVAASDEVWVWKIEFSDDAGRLCALVQVVVAVTPKR